MHVAIIMDGNGRWARLRGLPRTAGHTAGAKSVRKVVEAAAQLPIDVLTVYAFSSDNWKRPPDEVSGLFRLLRRYIQGEAARCRENGVRVEFIGRRDRIPAELTQLMNEIEEITQAGDNLLLRVAVDYSSRAQILEAARAIESDCADCDEFAEVMQRDSAANARSSNVDLLIRTGGECRLSDFLLWEAAYAELVFVDTWWPDFDEASLQAALDEFARRERRFGAVPSQRDSVLNGQGQ
jgi:undecaprenyl diphosphate synthase